MGVTAQDIHTSTSDVAEQSGSLDRMDRPSLAKSFPYQGQSLRHLDRERKHDLVIAILISKVVPQKL